MNLPRIAARSLFWATIAVVFSGLLTANVVLWRIILDAP